MSPHNIIEHFCIHVFNFYITIQIIRVTLDNIIIYGCFHFYALQYHSVGFYLIILLICPICRFLFDFILDLSHVASRFLFHCILDLSYVACRFLLDVIVDLSYVACRFLFDCILDVSYVACRFLFDYIVDLSYVACRFLFDFIVDMS